MTYIVCIICILGLLLMAAIRRISDLKHQLEAARNRIDILMTQDTELIRATFAAENVDPEEIEAAVEDVRSWFGGKRRAT